MATEKSIQSAEFTDAAGNPVEVDNHPVRFSRTDYSVRGGVLSDEEFERRLNALRPVRRYSGYIPAPKVYSTLAGDMVSTGVDLYQCEECGYWMSEKMSPSDEREHDRQHTR